MTSRAQWGIVGGVVAALAVALFVVVRTFGDELFPVDPGRPAPAWTARTLDKPARIRTGESYEGEVVLLNIWATWCQPCRVEMPSLQALHQAYADSGLHIVAVSIDDPGQERGIREFAQSYGLTFEILHDPSKRIQKIFQTTGVPETFVIGADGIIRRKMIGAEDWNSAANRGLVSQLLRERARERGDPGAEPSGRVQVPVRP